MNGTTSITASNCSHSQKHIISSSIYGDAILPVLIAVCFPTCIMNTISNLIVICTIVKTTTLHSPANFIILGLAISDLGVGAIGQPLYTVILFYELKKEFRYYCVAYDMFYCINWILAGSSILTLTALTADRFIAVHFHLRYREIVTSRRVVFVLLLVWAFSILTWSTYFFINKRFATVQETMMVLVIFLDIFFIIKIYQCARRHVLQIEAQQQAAQQSVNVHIITKSLRPMYYMFGAFAICVFPVFLTTIVLHVIGNTTNIQIAFKVTELLVLLNSLVNPMIYYWRIEEFRAASFNLLKSHFT